MKPLRKRHQERRRFARGQGPAADAERVFDVREWRQKERYRALADFARRTNGLKWSKRLFLLLLEELWVGDEFDELVGGPARLAPSRYPQALAFAIALRRSWRPDDLGNVVRELLGRRHSGTSH